jgi:peroxiredoxin
MKSKICCLLLFCLWLSISQTEGFMPQDDVESYTRTGQEMPDFTVTSLDGTRLKMSELKGRVVLINFWATWCPPCRVEMPRLEKEVWRKYKSADFVMVAIAREQTAEEIAEFGKEYGYSFPLAPDPQREVYRLFGNGGIPRSYVVGRNGKILYQSVGYDRADFDRMKKILEKELAKNGEAGK